MNTYKFKLNKYKDKIWYLNDDYHRDLDRPAWIWPNGTKGWYQHGNNHRDNDKPAIISSNGTKFWCQHNKWHRDNNFPAKIWDDGGMEYWVNGDEIK
jgi:hypothetical protein